MSTTPAEPKEEPKSALSTEPKTEAKPEDKPKAPEGAPEKYEDFKAPEGYELDKTMAAEAGTLFKKMNLSQAQAQELVDFYSAKSAEIANRGLQTVKDMRAGWLDQIKTSNEYQREFGADGKIKTDSKVLAGMARMIDSVADKKLAGEVRQALDLTGAGDHPAIFKFFDMLAKHFSEGTPVRGNGPSPHGTDQPNSGRRSAAQEIYPKLPSASGA